ncbi:MAG: sigma-70 family RNA polymerase sigma factor [Solirubrobacteraceae bacterium]
MSDEGLSALASLGDDDAFSVIVARHRAAIVRYCTSILLNQADAEDAAQTAIVNARAALRRRGGAVALRPWLFRIAHNEAISLLRRRRPSEPLLDLDGVLPNAGGDVEVDALGVRERMTGLMADLRELPERQRAALLMRELVGLSYEEIGDALGGTPAAIMQTVFEARRSLRQHERGRELDCIAVQHSISDGDRRRLRGRAVRAHLHSCVECDAFASSIAVRRHDLCLLFPLAGKGVLLAAGGWLGVGGARMVITGAHSAGTAPGARIAAAAAVLAGVGGVTVKQIVASTPAPRAPIHVVGGRSAHVPARRISDGRSIDVRLAARRGGAGADRASRAGSAASRFHWPTATSLRPPRTTRGFPAASGQPRPTGPTVSSDPPTWPTSTGQPGSTVQPPATSQLPASSQPPASSPVSQQVGPSGVSQQDGQASQQIGPGGITLHYGQASQQIGPGGITQHYGQASQQIGPGGITEQAGQASLQVTPGCVREQAGGIVLQWGPSCPTPAPQFLG